MSKRIVLLIFVISLVLSLPSIVAFVMGNFDPVEIFQNNPVKNGLKSFVLRDYPEWKQIESELENVLPGSSINTSVSEHFGENSNTIDLKISVVTDNPLSPEQFILAQNTVCGVLKNYQTNYNDIVLTASNLKEYVEKQNFQCE